MPCQLPEEINNITNDVYSYMCNLAMEKCSKKTEKKKASCGGAAMRKRLLIKNFVAQMLAQERETRDQELLRQPKKSLDETCTSTSSSFYKTLVADENDNEMASDSIESEEDEFDSSKQDTSILEDSDEDEAVEDEEQEEQQDQEGETDEDEEAEAAAASILSQQQNTNVEAALFLREQQNNQSQFGGWRTSSHLQRDDKDEFHKVPIQNQPIDKDNLNIFYSDLEFKTSSDMNSCPHQHDQLTTAKTNCQLYGLEDVTTTAYGYSNEVHSSNFVTFEEDNIMGDNANKLKLATVATDGVENENNTKLLLVEEHQPMFGLVNMVPHGLKFNFGDNENIEQQMMSLDGEYEYQESLYHQSKQHQQHCLIELDNVKLLDDNDYSDDYYSRNNNHSTNLLLLENAGIPSAGRKRPWTIMFDEHEQMMMEMGASELDTEMEHHHSGNMSPLCCGLLQLQPFASSAEVTAVAGTGMTPLVKRLKL